MAANSSAHPSKAGFNQSGGAHFIVMSPLANADGTTTTNNFVNTLLTGGSNSGGAYVQPTFAPTLMSAVIGSGTTAANAAGFVQTGKLLKDMGRSVVSSGRVFRRFQPVVANLPSSFGVVGQAGSAINAGYGSFYLEVGREGTGAAAPIARYF